jgi:hypothetical protein
MCDGSSPAVDRSGVLSRIGLIPTRLSKSSAAFPRRLINSRYLANDSRSSEDVGPIEVAPVEFVLLAALPLVLDSPLVTSPTSAGSQSQWLVIYDIHVTIAVRI